MAGTQIAKGPSVQAEWAADSIREGARWRKTSRVRGAASTPTSGDTGEVASGLAAWLLSVLIAEHAFVVSQGTPPSRIAIGAVASTMVFLAGFWRRAAFRNFVMPVSSCRADRCRRTSSVAHEARLEPGQTIALGSKYLKVKECET
jgi:hypothetical protein